MVQEFIMSVGQELDNMTHKQYLRKVEKLEKTGDSEALEILEQERMESLEEHLDFDWIDDDPTECFDLG